MFCRQKLCPLPNQKWFLWFCQKACRRHHHLWAFGLSLKEHCFHRLKTIWKLDATNMHWIFRDMSFIHVFQCFHFSFLYITIFPTRQHFFEKKNDYSYKIISLVCVFSLLFICSFFFSNILLLFLYFIYCLLFFILHYSSICFYFCFLLFLISAEIP